MLEEVLAGRDLERTAALAAPEVGGAVAIIVPAAGVAVAWPPRSAAEILELRRYAAQRLDGGPAAVPAGLALERTIGGGSPGVVLLLDAAPDRRRHAADVLHLVETTARVALALDDGADGGHVAERLLLDLLDEPAKLPAEEVLARGRRAGADLSRGAAAVCTRVDDGLADRARAVLLEQFPDALVTRRGPRLHALLPARETAAARLADRFALTPLEPEPGRLGRALNEARLAADARAAGAGDVGESTYRLLIRVAIEHPDELQRFVAATVGALADYDAEHGTPLLDTLRSYLEHDCTMNATAAAIFAHRHTVAYRLERVRELTGLDPQRHEHRERLGLGLKAHALLAAAG